jgi:orotidine-5'-phosphate decarboxylase
MTRKELFEQICLKRSFLCIGLDTDVLRVPGFLQETSDPVFAFNKEIIDATHDLCIAYKPNLAFYESRGMSGWASLEKTVIYLRQKYPEMFIIADAKRGDIGNTSAMYARAFFDQMDFDAVTVSPYMGEDSVKPFTAFLDRWVILLALTSNRGASDFQLAETKSGEPFYSRILNVSQKWGNNDSMMYVVGATNAEKLEEIRKVVPDHFLLVPGIGAQGGSLKDVARYGLNKQGGLIVNASRTIIYASDGKDFAQRARDEAIKIRNEMEELLLESELISCKLP